MVKRSTPTPDNYGTTIPDEEYAGDVNDAVDSLSDVAVETVTDVAGTNAITGTLDEEIAEYTIRYYSVTPENTNTDVVTLDLGPGERDWNDQFGNPLSPGDLSPDVAYLIYYNGVEFRMAYTSAAGDLGELPIAYIGGFKLSTNVSDANNDIDVTEGQARDSTNTSNLVGTAMTKQSDAVWAAGTNAGGMLQSANLTGTITITTNTTVTGTGTTFLTDFAVGDVITTAGGQARRITVVGGNLTMTVESNWGSGETGVTYKRGGKAKNTKYRFFAILKDSDDSVDYAYGVRATPTDLPTGYTKFRRLGWVLVDTSVHNLPFDHFPDADLFLLRTIIAEVVNLAYSLSGAGPTTQTTVQTSNGPPGVIARLNCTLDASQSSFSTTAAFYALIKPTSMTGTTSANPFGQLFAYSPGFTDGTATVISLSGAGSSQVDVPVDSSAQYTILQTNSGALSSNKLQNLTVELTGWTDKRIAA